MSDFEKGVIYASAVIAQSTAKGKYATPDAIADSFLNHAKKVLRLNDEMLQTNALIQKVAERLRKHGQAVKALNESGFF